MTGLENALVTQPVRMPTTMWTAIFQARQAGHQALDVLIRKYRPPVLAFVRNAGFDETEAEDLAQEVFLTLIRDDILDKADKGRGKFRSLLLGVTRHTISTCRRHEGRVKRGGDMKRMEPEADASSSFALEELLAGPETDETFDFLWVENLVRIGMSRLREECEREGSPYFTALFLHTNDRLDYPGIAQRLGASDANVKNYLHQARLKLKRHVLREVKAYSSSPTEYESEIAYLMKFLA
jgi:RNA polymerase sigma-70 factor (ECF subfamily)